MKKSPYSPDEFMSGLYEKLRAKPYENAVTKEDVLLTLGQVGCPACGGNLDLFNAMGVTTTQGNPWTAARVRSMLQLPVYISLALRMFKNFSRRDLFTCLVSFSEA